MHTYIYLGLFICMHSFENHAMIITQQTQPYGTRTGPVWDTKRVPYGQPGGIPPVFVRGIRSGPVRDIRAVIPGGSRTYPLGGVQSGPIWANSKYSTWTPF